MSLSPFLSWLRMRVSTPDGSLEKYEPQRCGKLVIMVSRKCQCPSCQQALEKMWHSLSSNTNSHSWSTIKSLGTVARSAVQSAH